MGADWSGRSVNSSGSRQCSTRAPARNNTAASSIEMSVMFATTHLGQRNLYAYADASSQQRTVMSLTPSSIDPQRAHEARTPLTKDVRSAGQELSTSSSVDHLSLQSASTASRPAQQTR